MYYDCLIDAVCFLGWTLVLWPAFFYLISRAGWAERRQRIFTNFTDDALKRYFELYFPVDIEGETGDFRERFTTHYGRHYGRRHLGIPLVLLAVVAGLGMWGTAETLRTWQTGHASFVWPPIVLSAFLGAFTWVTSDQLDRLRRRDLAGGDIYNGVFRFLIAIPFGVALAAVSPKDAAISVAFLIGVFPTATLFTIGRRIASKHLGLGDDPATVRSDLEILQNVGKGNAERFADEGVTTIAELAWTDPVDLAVRTNFDFNYVSDCMGQALLAVYVGEDIKKLGLFSLRGAMEAAAMIDALGDDIESANPTPEQRDARKALAEAAVALSVDPKTLRYTLDAVAADPYTQFIWSIWGVPAPPP
jgi:hypothetical protein